jgi:acetolactate synthase regulatory subunit
MWCIGTLTEEYRLRMYALLELYARPTARAEPVICIDEKRLQLVGHSRAPLPLSTHSPAKADYEYVRHGTTNLFVAVETRAGQRIVSVTEHRGKADFVAFIVAASAKRSAHDHRVEIHATGCRSEARSKLRSKTCVSMY